jgi:UDP-N-acetyl-2-amino-2-deoxyglucuronate dehydrogenase
MKRFALIGAAGYIAPRHMKAIKDTGNELVAAFDPYDGVGIMDSHFPDVDFFTEFERFDRHIDKLRREGNPIDYISICSPNYLHDAHIRFGLRSGCNVICEKPLVLNPWNVDALQEIEKETGKKVNTILQLRLHEGIIALREKVLNGPKDKIYDVSLEYMTSRGKWYHNSWKGDLNKSGGIATNIGVHFFDMLTWVFGDVIENVVHEHSSDTASGFLHLERARVKWFLSIDYSKIPEDVKLTGKRTYRTLKMEGDEIEFSDRFTELHTKSYRNIIDGEGFDLMSSKKAIEIVSQIRAKR